MEAMRDQRWGEIIRYLYEEKREVSLEELAEYMEMSPKAVRCLLEEHSDMEKEYGCSVQKSPRQKYILRIEEPERFFHILFERKDSEENDIRKTYMLDRLLSADQYCRIEDLAEELYVSRATLDRLMPDIKKALARYSLRVLSRPKYGLCIEGSEMNKRLCYAHLVRAKKTSDEQGITLRVQEILYSVILRHKLMLNDINFYNLVQHCIVAIHRIRENNVLEDSSQVVTDAQTEREAAREIRRQFESTFGIDIPESEETYLTIHLLGKRMLEGDSTIRPEIYACVDRILKEIQEHTGFDFRVDEELRTSLALHIQPLVSRLQFGLKQENPMLGEIKREMREGYELAVYAADVIYQQFGFAVDDGETGYLAMHLSVALEKQMCAVKGKKKVVIVCASGRGTSRLIEYRLVQRYHMDPQDLLLTSVFRLKEIDFCDVACILSTVPIGENYHVPTVLIDLSLSERSLERVDRMMRKEYIGPYAADEKDMVWLNNCWLFPDLELNSREDVLNFLCDRIGENHEIPVDFREQVFRREELSSTEVGNRVALPHPYIYQGEDVFMYAATLKKAIFWEYHRVQLVILLALPGKDSDSEKKISNMVTRLVCDKRLCRKLCRSLDRKTMEEVVGEMME